MNEFDDVAISMGYMQMQAGRVLDGGQFENWTKYVCRFSINSSNFTAFNGFCTFTFPFSDDFIHFESQKVFSCSNNKVLFTLLFISFSSFFPFFFPSLANKKKTLKIFIAQHVSYFRTYTTSAQRSAQETKATAKKKYEERMRKKQDLFHFIRVLWPTLAVWTLEDIFSLIILILLPPALLLLLRLLFVVLLFAFIPSIILPIDVWPFSLALALPYCHYYYYCYCWSLSIQWRAIHRGPYTRIP